MVLAWVIIILLITAPLWIWALYLLFLAKLEELGSPSVTKLDPGKYAEMAEFLNNL